MTAGFSHIRNILFGAAIGFGASLVITNIAITRNQMNGKPFHVGSRTYICTQVARPDKQQEETPSEGTTGADPESDSGYSGTTAGDR